MRVVLSLEGEQLKILDNLLPHEQNSWAEIEDSRLMHVLPDEACEELTSQQ